MTETRRERRQRDIAKRKADAKARMAAAPTPPTVPVAMPWKRRARATLKLSRATDPTLWSTMMSGEASDLPGSLAAAASMALLAGRVLRRS